MGIDPGVANTGFGVVRVAGGQMVAVDGGVIEAPDAPLEQRLECIHSELEKLIAWHEPGAVALEDLYFGKNARTAIAVGQARGVAMLAAAQRGIPLLRLYAAGGQDGGLRQRLGGQGPGAADGRLAARARPRTGVRPHRRRAGGGDLPRGPRAGVTRRSSLASAAVPVS